MEFLEFPFNFVGTKRKKKVFSFVKWIPTTAEDMPRCAFDIKVEDMPRCAFVNKVARMRAQTSTEGFAALPHCLPGFVVCGCSRQAPSYVVQPRKSQKPRGRAERGLLTRSAVLHRNCSSSRKSSHTRACGQDFPSREAPHAGPAKPRLGLNKSNRRKETAGFQKSSSAAIIAGDPGAGGVHKRDELPLQRGHSGGTAHWDRCTEAR